MPTAIDFWILVGSTYSYLTVMRVAQVSERTGIRFNWRPFSVRSIMIEQKNIPFRDKPVNAAYMWRDIQRRAGLYGLRPKLPAPYPLQAFDMANRVAIVAAEEGWAPAYIRAAYVQWFELGHPAGEEPNLSASIREAGHDPGRVIAAADGESISVAFIRETAIAKALGVFGAPSFVVGGEVFWGDDRLDDAVNWAKHGAVSTARTSG